MPENNRGDAPRASSHRLSVEELCGAAARVLGLYGSAKKASETAKRPGKDPVYVEVWHVSRRGLLEALAALARKKAAKVEAITRPGAS